jgi:two-component system cell cycle response regulator
MPSRILVIEDNPANLELMVYLLNAFGYIPLTARNGEEGLSVARRESPGLIVCDIQLPGMDGLEVARRLKQDAAFRAIPLIAVTAFAMVGDRDKVLASGFDGYISKPIDPEKFVPQLEAFLPSTRPSRPVTEMSISVNAMPAKPRQAEVLVVDDHPVNLSLKRSILEPVGYTVVTAGGMTKALELARKTLPDLIVSDLGMSDGDGFDLIKAVKADEQLKEIPFIFLTSTHCNETSRAKGIALGAAKFLFRPLEPQALLAIIEESLAGRKLRKNGEADG